MSTKTTFNRLSDMVVDATLANPDWFRQMVASTSVMLLNRDCIAGLDRLLPDYKSFGLALEHIRCLIGIHLKDNLIMRSVTYQADLVGDHLRIVVSVDDFPFFFELYPAADPLPTT